MNILVTGGAGYIGSHTVVELLDAGHKVVILDNLSNSRLGVLDRITQITRKKPKFYKGDIRDKAMLTTIFSNNRIEAVMHFAGLKAVGESVENPLIYYQNNLAGTTMLCEAMKHNGIKKLIFSSSTTVYGEAKTLPLKETSPVGVSIPSPYGRTKYMIEQLLSDLAASDSSWEITSLRYFNPIGAHGSGLIGEDPEGVPNCLLPYISRVAVGVLDKLQVFGNDYDTPDGTCIRDYVHVVDVAKGHLAALEHIKPDKKIGIFNLGTGKGSSVLEVIRAFEKASGKKIPYEIVDRRSGDVVACYANVSKSKRELNWHSTKTLADACVDTWRWQSQNPSGYR